MRSAVAYKKRRLKPPNTNKESENGYKKQHSNKNQDVKLNNNDEEDALECGSNRHVTKRVHASRRKWPRKPTGSNIVYLLKQRDCESVRDYAASSSVLRHGRVAANHGGMSGAERSRVQTTFEKGTIYVLVATVALGLAVHCDHVKGVIHFDLPASAETYVQEIGRAGRDVVVVVIIQAEEGARTNGIRPMRVVVD